LRHRVVFPVLCGPPYEQVLNIAPRPSVRLSVRPSRTIDFLEIGKPQKLRI